MDNLNSIPNVGNWGDAASKLNDNFNKIKQSLTTVENTSKNNKGYFTSLSALNTAFPSPKAGLTAYVYGEASSTNYYIYNAVNGAWVTASIEAPSVGVDLAEYTKTGGSTKTTKDIDDVVSQLADSIKFIALKNLFNPAAVQVDKFVSNVGTIESGTGWKCSAFIPVVPGQVYTLSGSKSRRGFAFYDASFTSVRYLDSLVTGTVTAQTGEVYAVFNLESPAQPGYSNIQFEKGSYATSYEPFRKLVAKEGVEGLEQAILDSQSAALTTSQLADNIFYKGVATPSTNPGTPDANVFYLASTPGVYSNFGGATIEFGDIHILQKSAPNAWESIRIYQLADSIKLITLKNLFNPAAVQVDKYINTNGVIMSEAGWKCSAFIPVVPDQAYTLSGSKSRRGFAFYDASFTSVRYLNIVTGTVTAQTGEVYAVFNLESPSQPGYSNIQFEKGSSATPYEPFERLVAKDGVEGLEQAILDSQAAVEINDKIRVFEFDTNTSTNLLNPNTVTPNSVVAYFDGTLAIDPSNPATQDYNTTDFMPVNPSTAYRMLNINADTYARNVAFYNASKVYVSGLNNPGTNIPVPAGVAYCRISMRNNSPMSGYGFFEGASAMWEPFGGNAVKLVDDSVPTDDKENNAIASIADVKAIASQSEVEATEQIQYTLDSTNLTINYGDGNVVTGFVGNDRGFSGNNMFNFNGYNINGVADSTNDDVAPMHALNTTIGANHGQPYSNGTVTAHGLDNTAIGTEWTNGSGTKFYIMRIVDANTIAFLGQNNGTSASPSFTSLSAGTLTQGGNTLTVSAVSGAQLYPSIKNLNIKVLANGVKEVTSGNGSANFLDVVESYEIMSIDSILQNTIARAGTSEPAVYDGDSFAVVENIYRFVPGLACVVIVNVHFLQSVAFSDIMANQAIRIGTNGITQYYIPNSNPIPAGDFRTPLAITWGSGTSSGYITNTAMPDPDNPPNRIINYFNDLGFSLGYITTKGTGKAINEFSARSFELRSNTGKIYPHPVEGTKVGNPVPANSIFNMVMFRAFTDLTVSRVGNRLSYFTFPFDGKQYVFVDYSGSMIDKLDLKIESLNGKDVTVVESKNTALKTDVYNDGIYLAATYVAGETCYAVLTIG